MAVANSLSQFNQITGMLKESYNNLLRYDSDKECDLICHAVEVHSGENSTKQRKGSKLTTVGNPITPSMLGGGSIVAGWKKWLEDEWYRDIVKYRLTIVYLFKADLTVS